jgi:LmbE family N-acetylglucosaminyl deacetylase
LIASDRVGLVGVFAHPDDDVYTMGGTLVLHASDLAPTFVFCTSGEAGPIWVEGIATRETLGQVREGEQGAAMAALGVEAESVFLHHPDFSLREVPFEQLVGEVEDVLRRVRPEVVVTFGPDGLTTHDDHVRAGEAADAAFHRARQDVTDGTFQRLLHVAIPRSVVDRFHNEVRELRKDLPTGSPLNLAGPADDQIAVAVDTRSVAAAKLRGIGAHRTQIGELEQIPESARCVFTDTEWFVQAWPPPAPGRAVVDDLLAGIEPSRSMERTR